MAKNVGDISILDQIETAFLQELNEDVHFDAATLEALRLLVEEGGLNNPDRLRSVFEDSEEVES